MAQFAIITGVAEIDRKLKGLVPKLQKKALRQSIRAGLKIVQREVKAQAPVDTGLMKSKVKVRATKSKRKNNIGAEVRIGSDEGLVKTSKGGKRAFYPAVVEFGSARVPANPFMRRAYESKGEEARQITMMRLLLAIEALASE